jgi:hypothetical protein
VWGESKTITLSYSDVAGLGKSGGAAGFDFIIDPITFNFNNAYGHPKDKHIKVYASSSITFSGARITKIVMTATSDNYIKTWTGGDVKVSGKTATWEGESSNLILNNNSSSQARITSITVTYEVDESMPVITSLSVKRTSTNTTYYVGDTTSPEGLVVEATYNNQSSKEVTSYVSWSFIPEKITKETKTITAKASYEGLSAEFSFDIIPKSIANEAGNAYSVADAYDIIDNGRGLSEEVYVRGIVSQLESFNSTYGSISYWISEDGTLAGKQFQCYGGLDLDGNQFTSIDDLKLGTVVVVRGILKKHNDIYEFDKNNVIVLKDESNIKTLSSIEISGSPVKTSYVIGETPTADGLIVNAIYSDNSKIDVTDDVIWTFNPEVIVEGITEVVVTAEYFGMEAISSFGVDVNKNSKITDYTQLEDGKRYYIGATLSNGIDYYFSTTYAMETTVKGVAQTEKINANILIARGHKSEPTKWAFQFDNGKYLNLKESKDNGKVKIVGQEVYWTLSNTSKNLINMKINGYCLQRNNTSGTTNFGSYNSGQTDVWFLEVPAFDINVSSAGYATFCIPYNATVPDGLTAYTASENGESIRLTKIESGKIAAGEGVVLKGEEGIYTFIATAEDVMPAENNLMVGVSKDTELVAADNVYLLTRKKDDGSIAFRLLNNNYTLGANKAYLKLKDSGASESRDFIPALWEEEATGIVDLNNVSGGLGEVYNLSGQRLLELQRGINIVNGKLVIK